VVRLHQWVERLGGFTSLTHHRRVTRIETPHRTRRRREVHLHVTNGVRSTKTKRRNGFPFRLSTCVVRRTYFVTVTVSGTGTNPDASALIVTVPAAVAEPAVTPVMPEGALALNVVVA
jgi:hypothetical protein